jgi:hypothetical protein
MAYTDDVFGALINAIGVVDRPSSSSPARSASTASRAEHLDRQLTEIGS